MTLINQVGYMETAYLSDEGYMGGKVTDANGAQFRVIIQDRKQQAAHQFKALAIANSRVCGQIKVTNTQAMRLGSQFRSTASSLIHNAEQFRVIKAQVTGRYAEQFNRPFHFWKSIGGYLSSSGYMQDFGGYLAPSQLNYYAEQFQVIGSSTRRLGEQTLVVNTAKIFRYAEQFRTIITRTAQVGVEFGINNAVRTGNQFRVAVYNTTGLRILTEFPSRGTEAQAGNNWTATSTATGDFSPNNLNSDIIEQYWRSVTGVLSNVQLVCDTGLPQGAFVDTVALLGHNLSGGATIFVEGSNSPSFLTPGANFFIRREAENCFYITQGLPLDGYRYWRFTLTDIGNPDNFLKVGTIVFGSALIFAGECFTDMVKLNRKQYVDSVFTEGFTNVKNNRGQRKSLQLEFQSLNYKKNNYRILRSIAETYGTIFKCLWIPIPQYASRFAVFGKLTELPSETHNDRGESNDYVSMSVNIDEAE